MYGICTGLSGLFFGQADAHWARKPKREPAFFLLQMGVCAADSGQAKIGLTGFQHKGGLAGEEDALPLAIANDDARGIGGNGQSVNSGGGAGVDPLKSDYCRSVDF